MDDEMDHGEMDHGEMDHGEMDMGGHGDGSGGMDMSMQAMRDAHTVFSTSHSTSLYSERWTPSSTGTYAGTCIFLIFFAVIFRALLASRTQLERRWLRREQRRRYLVTAVDQATGTAETKGDAEGANGADSADPEATTATLVTADGKQETVRVAQQPVALPALPWRLSTELPRALLVTVIVGVGYLLMLAAMTMNVGYFLSILGGVFLGDLALGRFTQAREDH